MSQRQILHVVQKRVEERLAAICPDEAAQQARLIICHVLKMDLLELISMRTRELSRSELEAVCRVTSMRERGYPLQYIFGEWEFFGLELYVDERALIPRQDTETLVEAALRVAREINADIALDMCCGSGCVGIALSVYGGLLIDFADISQNCLKLTEQNAQRHSAMLGKLILSDLFNNISDVYDIIAVNPPYLTGEDITRLQREIVFEPQMALYGGDDGLDFYRRISSSYKTHLKPGGALLMEVGDGQADAVLDMFGGGELVLDLCGKKRVVIVWNR